MASDVDICNAALSHLAISSTIANLTTDRSREALACAAFYSKARDETLRDFPWPFATVITNLALVESTPNVEWQYSYQVPTDCLRVRRILNGVTRQVTHWNRPPFRLVGNGLLYTDQANAQVEYTQRVTDPLQFPPDFIQTVALLMAGYMAPRLTTGDLFKLGDRALKLYEWRRAVAQANALSEEQADKAPDSDMIQAREGYADHRQWTYPQGW